MGHVEDLAKRCSQVDLNITADEVTYIKECTRLQADSLIWYEQRAGRITSSTVYEVLHTNPVTPAPSLILRLCDDSPKRLNVPAIKWGRDHEDIARQQYGDGTIQNGHSNIKIKQVGLVICQERPYLAASPDGLLSCDCHGTGVLEIKCPYKHHSNNVHDLIQDSASPLNKNLQLKPDHKYYSQVQLQMYTVGANYCDFVLWLPTGAISVTVMPDQQYINDVIPKLESFWQKHILPELLTRSLEERKKFAPGATSTSQNHCSCGHVDANPMIGCDDDQCPNQWYHWACVGITKKPRAKYWYCELCLPNNAKNMKPIKRMKKK